MVALRLMYSDEYLRQPYSITRKFLGHVMVAARSMNSEPR